MEVFLHSAYKRGGQLEFANQSSGRTHETTRRHTIICLYLSFGVTNMEHQLQVDVDVCLVMFFSSKVSVRYFFLIRIRALTTSLTDLI